MSILHSLPVSSERLHEIATASHLGQCDFLRLDLQGRELGALAGAGPLLGSVEVTLTDASWLQTGGDPLRHEVEVFDYRPLDRALWQTDVHFARHTSPLLASREWDRRR